jgi:hypothetical protein
LPAGWRSSMNGGRRTMSKVGLESRISIQLVPRKTKRSTPKYRTPSDTSGPPGAQRHDHHLVAALVRPGRRWPRRALIIVLFALLGSAANLAAQGQEPLLKSDIVRLLTTGALSQDEIAGLIGRNCLAFEPTARDREQFRELGASAAVMSAIDECGRRPRTVRVRPAESRVRATAGGTATVVYRVTLGAQPVEGVELVLRGSGALPGGAGADANAFSNSDGNVIFRIPVGSVPGTYQLTAAAAGEEQIEGTRGVVLTVTPSLATTAEVRPQRLEIQRGAAGTFQLTVTVRDQYGNVVADQEVALRPSSPAMGIQDARGTTDSRGEVTFSINKADVLESGRLAIVVGPNEVESVAVAVFAGEVASELTKFVAGTEQSGAVNSTLPRRLVLEVRDEAGLPIAGQQVVFTATNARVQPPVATTDSAGLASVSVQLGSELGLATISALVAGETVETTIRVMPGPAVSVGLLRNERAIGDELLIESKREVTLRVTARDAYGNRTQVTELRARSEDESVLRVLGVASDASGGRVTLIPRRDGQTRVIIDAAGLSEAVPVRLVLSKRPAFSGYTDLYGSGAVMTPHAFISPGEIDVAGVLGAALPQISGKREVDEGGSLVASWRGRAELGFTAYSTKDFGVPVKVQVLPPGPRGLAIAIGALNLVPVSDSIGRHGSKGGAEYYENYIDRASPYAVVSFAHRTSTSPIGVMFSLGWGAGMFLEKNPVYSDKGYTSGFFGSAALDAQAAPGVIFRLMLDHDGWDTNVAGTVFLYGVEVTAGLLAIDEGGAETNSHALNQMRFFARIAASLNQSREWLGL